MSKPIFVAYKQAFVEVQKALCVLLFGRQLIAGCWQLLVVQLCNWGLGWSHGKADGNKLYFFSC